MHSVITAIFAGLICLIGSLFTPAYASDEENLRQVMNLGNGGPIGRVYYNDEILKKRAISSQNVARIVEQAYQFHQAIWTARKGDPIYTVYMAESGLYSKSMANTSTSPTRQVVGTPKETNGRQPCTTVFYFQAIEGTSADVVPGNFEQKLAFTIAHELAHCFQRVSIKNHEETRLSPEANWLLEGSASWLAQKFTNNMYGGDLKYFQSSFKSQHRYSLFKQSNTAMYFFIFLESTGLKSTQKVIDFITDSSMPAPLCTSEIDLAVFPDKRSANDPQNCSKESPYQSFVLNWFQKETGKPFDDTLVLYAKTLGTNKVPGAPKAEDLTDVYHRDFIQIQKALVAARVLMGNMVPAKIPLLNIGLEIKDNDGLVLPEPFGVGFFKINLDNLPAYLRGGKRLIVASESIGEKVRLSVVIQNSKSVDMAENHKYSIEKDLSEYIFAPTRTSDDESNHLPRIRILSM